MLRQRLIFGTVMVAGLVALLWLDHLIEAWGTAARPGGGAAILALLAVLVVLGARELAALYRAKGVAADAWTLTAAGLATLGAMYALPAAGLATVLAIVLAGALVRHTWGGRTQGATAAAAATLLAAVYLGMLPGFYALMRLEHAVWVVAGLVALVKAGDIGAYFTGHAIGRHKLIPWLSPGKTWEGLAGGVALAAAVGVALAAVGNHFELAGRWMGEGGEGGDLVFEPMRYSLAWAAVAGVLLALAGHFGDLTASLLKRDANVKDSGRSLPGFGGVLDVADSPIMAAPLAYWLAGAVVVAV